MWEKIHKRDNELDIKSYNLYPCFIVGFYEERAILLGRLGRHEQALGIYIHVLHDTKLAEE